MKPSHAMSAFLLAAAAALTVACSAPAKNKSAAAPAPAAPVAAAPAAAPMCTSDAQCGFGACGRCDNGNCVRVEGCCEADNDCAPGSRCRAGRCR